MNEIMSDDVPKKKEEKKMKKEGIVVNIYCCTIM